METSRPGLFKILHNKNIINKTTADLDDGFKESQEEPNSPTISCVGKVQSREKCEKNLHLFFRRKICPFSSSSSSTTATPCRRKKASVLKPGFYLTEDEKIPKNMRNKNNTERKSSCKLRGMWKVNNGDGGRVSNSKQGNHNEDSRPNGSKVDVSGEGCKLREEANCLMSKMRRSVACRRGGRLANFDWKTTPEEAASGGESCYEKASACLSKMNRSTACRRGGALSNFDWRKEEDDEQCGAYQQQLVAVQVQVQPRREINLWQRRTIAKPLPIQLIASIS